MFDLDADGDLDLVVGRAQKNNNGAVETLLGAGDGSFVPGQSLAVPGSAVALAVLDVAQDGRPAVLALSGTGDPELRFFAVEDGGVLAKPDPLAGPARKLIGLGRIDGGDTRDVVLVGADGLDAILGQDPWPPRASP